MFTGAVTLLLQLVIFTGMARVGVKIPQDGNRANRYGQVAVVHEHVWRTVCSVCATGARVAQPVPCVICRSGGFTGTVTLLFQLVVALRWYGLV